MARFINKSFELPLYQHLFKMNWGAMAFPCLQWKDVHQQCACGFSKGRARGGQESRNDTDMTISCKVEKFTCRKPRVSSAFCSGGWGDEF